MHSLNMNQSEREELYLKYSRGTLTYKELCEALKDIAKYEPE